MRSKYVSNDIKLAYAVSIAYIVFGICFLILTCYNVYLVLSTYNLFFVQSLEICLTAFLGTYGVIHGFKQIKAIRQIQMMMKIADDMINNIFNNMKNRKDDNDGSNS